jgi:carboxypeptidase family protein
MSDRTDSRLIPRVLALLLTCRPGLLGAQAIRTTLVGAGTHQPVAGAFVVLKDTAGREVVRTLTDETGRVRLDAPPGAYRVFVLRIGMARWSGRPFTLAAGDTITTPIEAPEMPVLLSEIAVHAERRCRIRPQEGSAAAALWEEARKALEATEWTITHPVYRFQAGRYVRTFGPTGNRPLTEERHNLSGASSWPFASLAPESLAVHGFAQPDSQGVMTYYGPDLPVLLSGVFLERHCFRVARARGAAADSLIGLAFEPVGRRRGVDVGGVLWLERISAALDELEFRYTSLGRWASSGAGGRVAFQRLPNGAWVIRRWHIRMPIPLVGRRIQSVAGELVQGPTDTLGVAGYREEGGWIALVLSAEGRIVATYPDEP